MRPPVTGNLFLGGLGLKAEDTMAKTAHSPSAYVRCSASRYPFDSLLVVQACKPRNDRLACLGKIRIALGLLPGLLLRCEFCLASAHSMLGRYEMLTSHSGYRMSTSLKLVLGEAFSLQDRAVDGVQLQIVLRSSKV